jgi:hypothetical protein
MTWRAAVAARFARHVLLASLLLAMAGRAQAETRRIAIVVGSNQGDASHAPLRFAELDASKFAAVLRELGGLSAQDVLLLRGPSPAEVRLALDEATRRTRDWHVQHRGQVVLMFYFSGHSDGKLLELGRQGLPFAEVRARLGEVGADVRLVVLDSCRSGALLALKGGTLGQAFDIRMTDELASTGEALITSSAADESALESSEIEGSFFSHHLISGLRGAADLSGDGIVTLAEAYQYAFARTLRSTSETTVGPQHPAYDYRLTGKGDLALTELQKPSALVQLPAGFDRILLVAEHREQVLAELGPQSGRRLAVPAGGYQLRAWKGTQAYAARVVAQGGQVSYVAETALAPVASSLAVRKGGAPMGAAVDVVATRRGSIRDEDAPAPWALFAGLGLMDGAARDAVLASARVAVQRGDGAVHLDLVLTGGTGRAPGMRESRVTAEVAPSLWTGWGRLGAGFGLGLGAGFAQEQIDHGGVHWSGLVFVSPGVRFALRVSQRLSVQASAELPITLLRRDNHTTIAALGSLWLGLARSF